jgi:hypothetical protein
MGLGRKGPPRAAKEAASVCIGARASTAKVSETPTSKGVSARGTGRALLPPSTGELMAGETATCYFSLLSLFFFSLSANWSVLNRCTLKILTYAPLSLLYKLED